MNFPQEEVTLVFYSLILKHLITNLSEYEY